MATAVVEGTSTTVEGTAAVAGVPLLETAPGDMEVTPMRIRGLSMAFFTLVQEIGRASCRERVYVLV